MYRDPIKYKAAQRRYKEAHPDRLIAKRYRQHLRRKYSMTIEQYEELLAEQDGGCAICGRSDPGDVYRHHLFVDHDHETGKVRGLLCANCNALLGQAKDDTARLAAAILYLERARS